MNLRRPIGFAAIVIAAVLSLWPALAGPTPAATPGSRIPQQTQSSLVGRMYGVTMLEFRTDHPLHEVRVIVDGNVLGTLQVALADKQTTLKLAVAFSQRQKSAAVYLDTVNYSTDFTASFPPIEDARDRPPKEDYAPEKNVKLPESGWIELYRLSAERFKGRETIHYELKVEIR